MNRHFAILRADGTSFVGLTFAEAVNLYEGMKTDASPLNEAARRGLACDLLRGICSCLQVDEFTIRSRLFDWIEKLAAQRDYLRIASSSQGLHGPEDSGAFMSVLDQLSSARRELRFLQAIIDDALRN